MIQNNAYYDSVALMQISKAIEVMDGVTSAMVCMGTEMNKELLKAAGLLNEKFEAALTSDLIISFKSDEDFDVQVVYETVEKLLNSKKDDDAEKEMLPTSLASAYKRYPASNIAVMSLPGAYVVQEVKKALKRNMHVMLFSDNVSIEDEISLKKLAHEKGLLMMGPDCGTAIINNVGLCFANQVKKGHIGVVGASGTGTQEVTALIDHMGSGVSQVIGTGGRDLSLEVGGIMMLDGFQALEEDPMTDTIVLISKPPVKSVANKIIEGAKKSKKNVVICFINSDFSGEKESTITFTGTLEAAAYHAVKLSTNKEPKTLDDFYNYEAIKQSFYANIKKEQKYVRGLYCGGTICDETAFIFGEKFGDEVYSNVGKVNQLKDAKISYKHSFIDLGDDEFTVGKPHPMIEPDSRNKRIIGEALDPETAIILFDVELGYGSHRDPAKSAIESIKKAKEALAESKRTILFVAYVLGTEGDLQNYRYQIDLLESEGVIVARSNARAAKLCADLIGGIGNE